MKKRTSPSNCYARFRQTLKLSIRWLRQNKLATAILAGWSSFFIYLWLTVLKIVPDGHMVAFQDKLWGDWSLHFLLGTAFAERGWQVLQHSPLLITEPLRYPFVADFLSGGLMKLGMGMLPAFVLPSLIFSLAAVFALFTFQQKIFRSSKVAAVAVCFFFLAGGTGLLQLIQENIQTGNLGLVISKQLSPATDNFKKNIVWIAPVNSMILPQRALTMGLPITLGLLIYFYRGLLDQWTDKGSQKRRRLLDLAAAVALGVLPIIHTHSAIAAALIISCWYLLAVFQKRNMAFARYWAAIGVVSLVTGLAVTKPLISGEHLNGFLGWQPGWMAGPSLIYWLIFWLQNLGVVLPMAIVGWWLFHQTYPKRSVVFLPFVIIFVLANLIRFQAWEWDNTKLLLWSLVAAAGLAAYSLRALWRHSSLGKILAILLFLIATTSSGYDTLRTLRVNRAGFTMYSADQLEAAERIRRQTPADSVWLTHDYHHHWLITLTGRQAVMAYSGWLWSHGYDYAETQTDIAQIYSNPVDSQHLLNKYGVTHILVGPEERGNFGVNDQDFAANFPLLLEGPHYKVFLATEK